MRRRTNRVFPLPLSSAIDPLLLPRPAFTLNQHRDFGGGHTVGELEELAHGSARSNHGTKLTLRDEQGDRDQDERQVDRQGELMSAPIDELRRAPAGDSHFIEANGIRFHYFAWGNPAAPPLAKSRRRPASRGQRFRM